MKNKQVGMLVIGIAVVIAVVVFLFNNAMTNIVNTSCSHGPSCAMYGDIKTQTYVSMAIIAVIIIIGIVLMLSKESVQIRTIKAREAKSKIDLTGLDKDEKQVIKIVQEENGAIFQASLMEKMSIGKVGMTRLLDKLEAKQIIERKRRGMNNVIVLK